MTKIDFITALAISVFLAVWFVSLALYSHQKNGLEKSAFVKATTQAETKTRLPYVLPDRPRPKGPRSAVRCCMPAR